MVGEARRVRIVGRLGVSPMTKLSVPARRLLAYLALRDGRAGRGRASADLWPNEPDEVGRANLRRGLWQVPAGWVEVRGDELELAADSDFAQARGVAARALADEPLTFDEIELLSADILPGWCEEWVLPTHEAFHVLRVQALEAACRTLSALGRHALAIQAGSAALMTEPLRESAAEALIHAHLAQSNRFEAARCFHALAHRLSVELGVEPDPLLTSQLVRIGLVAPEMRGKAQPRRASR